MSLQVAAIRMYVPTATEVVIKDRCQILAITVYEIETGGTLIIEDGGRLVVEP